METRTPFKTHAELVAALCKPLPPDQHKNHMLLGLAGEVGELIDCIKRNTIYEQLCDVNNLIEELGDIEFYLEGLRQGCGVTRAECIDANMRKLVKRYGEKYSNQAAEQRADKV